LDVSADGTARLGCAPVIVIETCVKEEMLTGFAPLTASLAKPLVNLIGANFGR
jgi:hypothetical protein